MRDLKSSNLTLIHGIRGICSLMVAVCHSKFLFWVGGQEYLRQYPRQHWNLLDYGLFGMDIFTSDGTSMVVVFFILSGFFIAYTLSNKRWTPFDFYRVRFLRIYIPYLSSLLFASLVFYVAFIQNQTPMHGNEANDLVKNTRASFNYETFFKTLFFLRNSDGLYMAMNFPYWSLFHEAIFYLLAPFLMRFPFSFVVSLVLYILGFFIDQTNMLLEFIFHYFFYFNLGMIFYQQICKGPLGNTKQLNWLFIFGLFAIAPFSRYFFGYRVSFLIVAVSALWAIQQIIYGGLKEFIFVKLFRQLGKISYTLYLFHIPLFILLLFLIFKMGISLNYYRRSYYLASCIVLLLAIPFYKLIEERSIEFIQKFRPAKRPADKQMIEVSGPSTSEG